MKKLQIAAWGLIIFVILAVVLYSKFDITINSSAQVAVIPTGAPQIVDQTKALPLNPQTTQETSTMELINKSVIGEQIKFFDSNTTINPDGSINVTEKIYYYFDTERHGIYRNIPFTKYDQGKRYDLDFKFAPVTDAHGKKYKVDKSKNGEQWILKIGDPDKTITGDHVYVISYTVKGAIGYFNDHDEFYWNVTGNEWNVPIRKTVATISLPKDIGTNNTKIACYTGGSGSQKNNCTGSTDGKNTSISTTLFLNSYEGITMVQSFPKGTVAVLKPELYVPFFERWYGKITLVGIIIAAIAWYIVLPIYLIVKWFQKGRDPEVGIAVTAAYEAPKIGKRFLTPGETGALLDETVDRRDLFATIVDLARRGHLKISEPENKKFHLIKSVPKKKDTLLPFEQALFSGIFATGDDVELKTVKLYTTAAAVESTLYSLLVTHGFFIKNPNTTRTKYYGLGAVALFTFNFVLAFIAFVFGRVMPRKTLLGAQTAKQAQGLKNFLSSQERQLNFQGEKQMMFEKLLPYAIAFGVEKQWAKRFETFDLKNPDWYTGSSSRHFSAAILATSLSNSYNSFASSSTPPSSSSSGFSGGSSGGGGGGGGGGSW